MIFRSIKDLSRDIREKLLPALPRDIGIVYGIPRSGMIPAGRGTLRSQWAIKL